VASVAVTRRFDLTDGQWAVLEPADGNKFPEYFRALYDKQPAEGVTSQKYANWVAYNTDTAAGKNIQGTPTVLVNGKQIQNTVNALQQAVG